MEKTKTKHKKTLKYYMYDWDDNILEMPTMIHVDKKVDKNWEGVDITTPEFREVRHHLFDYYENGNKNSNWRFRNDNRFESLYEFRDDGPRGDKAFLEDTQKAIKFEKFGPVWNEFIDSIIGGHRLLIVTARGHEPNSIKNTIKWIIYNILTNKQRKKFINNLKYWNKLFDIKDQNWTEKKYINYYLNLCEFIGIESDWFINKFNIVKKEGVTGVYKAIAIKYFVSKISKFGKILDMGIKVGFSDDDLDTVKSIHKYFQNELSLEYAIDFHSYHTKADGSKIKLV